MASRSYPTWATGGAMGIYSWPLPVVIAGSLVSTFLKKICDGQSSGLLKP